MAPSDGTPRTVPRSAGRGPFRHERGDSAGGVEPDSGPEVSPPRRGERLPPRPRAALDVGRAAVQPPRVHRRLAARARARDDRRRVPPGDRSPPAPRRLMEDDPLALE